MDNTRLREDKRSVRGLNERWRACEFVRFHEWQGGWGGLIKLQRIRYLLMYSACIASCDSNI
jgi:hypothetical protein